MKHKYLYLLLTLLLFAGCKNKNKELIYELHEGMPYQTAVLMGSTHDEYISSHYPKAKISRLEQNPDLMVSLDADKCDLILIDEVVFKICYASSGKYEVVEHLFSEFFGVGFSKENVALKDEFNRFLAIIQADGTYDEMMARWFDGFDNLDNASMPDLGEAPQGTPIRMGTTSSIEGFAYIQNGKPAGFDIELTERFSRFVGRPIEYDLLNFGGLIAALSAGKVDMISSGITITEERKKQVVFSDPYFESKVVTLVKKERNGLTSDNARQVSSLEDLNSSKVAIVSGLLYDAYMAEHYPQAELLRLDAYPDVFMALDGQKADVMLVDGVIYDSVLKKTEKYKTIGVLFEDPYGVGFGYDNLELRDKFNAFLKEIKENGIYDEMKDRWIDNYETAQMPEWPDKPQGKPLRLGCSGTTEAFDFIQNGRNAGFDIELIERFSRSIDRPIEYYNLKFSGLIAALSGKAVDMIASAMSITEERAKMVAYSDPYYISQSLAVVRSQEHPVHAATDATNQLSFTQLVKESFQNNLIKEKRYLLILEGLWQTILITLFAGLLGSIFGGIICYLRMSKHYLLNGFAKLYIHVMRGTPVLILLMFFFYVVFSSSGLSATGVAIFTFALNMGAYSSEMFRTAIESIDRGQQEAGIALGFTKLQTFIFIILPQAVKNVLPVYKGELISLLKATSIVGYIAVVDLTKASDIIRSRTFDAFFPLIVAAIIYFVLAWLMAVGLDYLNKKISSSQ